MPNCFQLISKATNEPAKFAEIDNELCAAFGVEPDAVKFYAGWYDIVGLAAACGKSFDDMREIFESPEILRVIDYLDARYTTTSWYQHNR